MRLPLIPPAQLTPGQCALDEPMHDGIKSNFKGFAAFREDGALMGPWNPWLHDSAAGKPIWELTKALSTKPSLPAAVRVVAILVTRPHFRAAYEFHAHVIGAENRGLSDDKLATIVAGQRPADLSRGGVMAYDVAAALVSGGVLPDLTYRAAVTTFGQHGATELMQLVGLYCMVSITVGLYCMVSITLNAFTLNAFDVPVPDNDG